MATYTTQDETDVRNHHEQDQNRHGESNHADRNRERDGKGKADSRDGKKQTDENEENREEGDKKEEPKPVDPAKRRRMILIAVVASIVVSIGALAWYLYSRTYESTDDAQVDSHLNPIAARISGTVQAVYVEDNQIVQAGQALVDLDPKDAQVQLAQAQAAYDQAVASLDAEDPNVAITVTSNASDLSTSAAEVTNAEAAVAAAQRDYDSSVAKLRQAEATNLKSQSDLKRYKQLLDEEAIAPSDYDQYLSNARSQEAAKDAAAATVESAQKTIEQKRAQLLQNQAKYDETKNNAPRQLVIKHANLATRKASVESYRAQLEQAQLSLAYCHVVAPVSGIVMQRSAEIGGRISAGQQLLMIAQIGDPWVTANFKETQVRKMHPGQKVKITVDALDRSFDGTVEDMPAATGDRASVLPAENATGNYVKVIQRLPVRIRFDKGQADMDKLRPGMSVEPKVYFD